MSPTTFMATCTYTNPDGTAARGTVTFKAINTREANTDTVQDAITIKATLDEDGAIAQELVENLGGYTVTERIVGSRALRYTIAGIADLDLSTVDAATSQYVITTGPTVRSVPDPTYVVVDADVNNVIDCTAACTVTIPDDLTVEGTVTISKGGTGDVTLAVVAGVTLDAPGGLVVLTTQFATMVATAWGSVTHYRLAGAEA